MRVGVVGGGISGISAAISLVERGVGRVTLFESSAALGGKIQSTSFLGHEIEAGPDAFLTRSPEALQLARKIGIEKELISPAADQALIWRFGRTNTIPKGLSLGAPVLPSQIISNEILTIGEKLEAYIRFRLNLSVNVDSDILGTMAQRRWGKGWATNILDPLLGGINASSIFDSSAEIVAPSLRSLMENGALRSSKQSQSPTSSPKGLGIFATPGTGLSRMILMAQSYMESLGIQIKFESPVESIARNKSSWSLCTKGKRQVLDAVVLALPAYSAAALIDSIDTSIADLLRRIEYSSVSIALFGYSSSVKTPNSLSGVLVPSGSDMLSTAISIASSKWPNWMDSPQTLLRVSAGRMRDRRHLSLCDNDLLGMLERETEKILGIDEAAEAAKLIRWPASFPQFRPHHRALISKIIKELGDKTSNRITLAGAYLSGSGITTCIRTGSEAAERIYSDTEPQG